MQRAKAEADLSIAKPATELSVDLCVIGGGSGGLSVAAGAVAFGQSVVLVERHKMGGDCLNYGCVPSKALIAAGKRAHAMRTSSAFGITSVEPAIDRAGVHAHVKSVIAAIAPNDSIERFRGLGVRVLQASARFTDPGTVMAGETRIRAHRFVIATGSSPAVPPITGLAETPYFTNETIFDNEAPLPHLIVIGGGPIGMELAQAHTRLGSRVTVVEAMRALAKDDPELTTVLLRELRAEGLEILEGAKVERVEGRTGAIRVSVIIDGVARILDATHLLVATGRKPNLVDLGLEAAGVAYDKNGITVDRGMRTTNGRIFAIGDCTGGLQFTHVANYQAGIVLKRALFRLPARTDDTVVPWVTYTEPELACVGLTEAQANDRGVKCRVLRWSFRENDRAHAERETSGHIKVITTPRGGILGAAIVGAHAGELIQVWALAISSKLDIKAMTDVVLPYPTRGEVNKRAAIRHFAAIAGNSRLRAVIGWLKKLG